MKAIVEDYNVTSLDVEFSVYGYKESEKPLNYKFIMPLISKTHDNNIDPECQLLKNSAIVQFKISNIILSLIITVITVWVL